MTVESATYIDTLVSTNPASGAGSDEADNHLRLIKAVLQNSFTSLSGAVTPTPAELNALSNLDITDYVPAGALLPYGKIASTPPSGWLKCDGSEILISDYTPLNAVIGTNFGIAGSPTTHIVLPDLTGRVTAGKDGTADFITVGYGNGEPTIGLTLSTIPSHAHSVAATAVSVPHEHTFPSEPGATAGSAVALLEIILFSGVGSFSSTSSPTSTAHTHTYTTDPTGSGTAHNNLAPYLVFDFIIKT